MGNWKNITLELVRQGKSMKEINLKYAILSNYPVPEEAIYRFVLLACRPRIELTEWQIMDIKTSSQVYRGKKEVLNAIIEMYSSRDKSYEPLSGEHKKPFGEKCWEYVRNQNYTFWTDLPLPIPKQPERNAICPCGSGKKYKNCCY